MAYLSKVEWGKVKEVDLAATMARDRGYRWLIRVVFKGLIYLWLGILVVDTGNNGIREKGCQHLSKLES